MNIIMEDVKLDKRSSMSLYQSIWICIYVDNEERHCQSSTSSMKKFAEFERKTANGKIFFFFFFLSFDRGYIILARFPALNRESHFHRRSRSRGRLEASQPPYWRCTSKKSPMNDVHHRYTRVSGVRRIPVRRVLPSLSTFRNKITNSISRHPPRRFVSTSEFQMPLLFQVLAFPFLQSAFA